MINGHELLGRPVIARDTGERSGEIEDLVVSDNGTRVLALEVTGGGFLAGSRFVLWESIQSVGEDAVIVDSHASLKKAEDLSEVEEVLERGNALIGREVHTTTGRSLGSIEAFFLDSRGGQVVGYELSGGPHAAEHGGRSFLRATSGMETGKDIVFVPPEAAEGLEDMHVALRSDEPRAA